MGVLDPVGGALFGGPWNLSGQTGTNGHLGVAVTGREDPCANWLCGDCNCDGVFNGADIDAFFLALGSPEAWQATYPGCDMICLADINYDNLVNGADIDPFFVALGAGACAPRP
jgi:hypothetical protein